MIKSMLLPASLLCMTALIGAGAIPARTLNPTLPSQRAAFNTLTLVSATSLDQLPSSDTDSHVRDSRVGPIGESSNDRYKGNQGANGGNGDQAPAPMPEPATILSMCVAVAIGGGVYFMGRLRRERK